MVLSCKLRLASCKLSILIILSKLFNSIFLLLLARLNRGLKDLGNSLKRLSNFALDNRLCNFRLAKSGTFLMRRNNGYKTSWLFIKALDKLSPKFDDQNPGRDLAGL